MSNSPMQTSTKYANGAASKIGEFTVPDVGKKNAYVVKINYYI